VADGDCRVAVGEVITAAAATGDQAWIGAVGKRANQVASVTISPQLPGGPDLDEYQGCVLIKPPITREKLA
jgi:hypothetical protein